MTCTLGWSHHCSGGVRHRHMLHFFARDPEQVRWELASCGSGACRLIVQHSQGTSVETFASTAQALRRVQQLEDYLDQARDRQAVQPEGRRDED